MVSKRKQVAMLSVPGRGRQFVAKLNTCTKSTTAKTRKLSPPDVQKRKKSVPTQERVPAASMSISKMFHLFKVVHH
jgi:hypothetical protein